MNDLEGEIWKVIKEASHYEVSNFGRFKRNRGTFYKKIKKSIQTTPVGPNGYPRKYLKDLKLNVNIHRLVAEAFIPNPDNKPCVNHIDCNRSNNHVSNLEWVTIAENQKYAAMLKRFPDQSGEKHGNTRYTNLQVSVIKEAIKSGHRNCHIARYFKMHPSTITMIKTGRQWKTA